MRMGLLLVVLLLCQLHLRVMALRWYHDQSAAIMMLQMPRFTSISQLPKTQPELLSNFYTPWYVALYTKELVLAHDLFHPLDAIR
jgi:hypothetical protein